MIRNLCLICLLVPSVCKQNIENCGLKTVENEGSYCQSKPPYSCSYDLKPLTRTFGSEVRGIELSLVDKKCAEKLTEELYMHRVLLFRGQTMNWSEQLILTSQFGEPYMETTSINRKRHDKIPDPRLGFFSNDINHGLTGVGTEGWHADGNTAETPHTFTILHCMSASKVGPTLFVPLKEITDMLTKEERDLLKTLYFVSGSNASIVHPLLYKNPFRNDDTIMLALGSLSGLYQQRNDDGSSRILSSDETQYIQAMLESKILISNLIYGHKYKTGDVFIWANHAVAHIAGPGTQLPSEVVGLRLVHRTSVKGVVGQVSKKTSLRYECGNAHPFQNGYCYFSLHNSVYYPRLGGFDNYKLARRRCQNVNKHSDLAVILNEEWNNKAKKIIAQTGVPHWLNGTNPTGNEVYWGNILSEFTNWDPNSGQPNDCLGPETCLLLGPFGRWFDFTCEPKTYAGADLGPVMTWEDGTKKEFNVYPLCGVDMKYIE